MIVIFSHMITGCTVNISFICHLFDILSMKKKKNQVMGAYGYNIEQILIIDVIPDPSVRKAMNEINAGILLRLEVD